MSFSQADDYLHLATRSPNGTWTNQAVILDGGSESSLAVDTHDRVHITYNSNAETLAYAMQDDTGWHFETIDANAPTGRGTNIQTDANDRPHIAYEQLQNRANDNDPLKGHIKYATQTITGDWTTEWVDATGLTQEPDLQLDRQGQPQIAYTYRVNQIDKNLNPLYEVRVAEPITTTALRPAWPHIPTGLA